MKRRDLKLLTAILLLLLWAILAPTEDRFRMARISSDGIRKCEEVIRSLREAWGDAVSGPMGKAWRLT